MAQPEDEEQREAIRDVLTRAGERMAAHQEQTRRQARVLLDSTRAELAEVLTPEQLQRLDEHFQSRVRNRRMRSPRDGPGRDTLRRERRRGEP